MNVYALKSAGQFYAFYSTTTLARKALTKKKKEIKARAVHITEDTEDNFSFYFGWEEHGVSWRIIKIEILEEA